MQSSDRIRTGSANRFRRGSALLVLLMGVVILMALYFIDLKAIFRPVPKVSKSGEVLPWFEEDRLVGPSKFVQLPKPPKPTWDKDFTMTAKVRREGQERGRIELEIGADGTIMGTWSCEFTQGKRQAEFMASFEGNIDITKTYKDAQGERPDYLYLYTKGKYTETVYDRNTTKGGLNGGLIYVTGWIRPEGGMFGTLTITTDKKWHGEYEWDTMK